MNELARQVAGVVGLTWVLTGCFGAVDLADCKTSADCPPETAACIDGECFHHSLAYERPLCGGGEGECCDYNGEEPSGCLVWTVEQWDEVSAPAQVPGVGFVFAARKNDKLHLVAVDSAGHDLWSGDLPAGDGILPAPAVNSSGETALVASDTLFRFDKSGTKLLEVALDLETAGSIAHSDDGDVYLLAGTKTVLDVPPNGQALQWQLDGGFHFQTVPAHLGPVVFPGQGVVIVPDDGGQRLAAVSLDEGKVAWVQDESVLEGQLLGIGAGPGPVVYAVTASKVLALDPGAGGQADSIFWRTDPLPSEVQLASPPVVDSTGRVIVATSSGKLVWFSKTRTTTPGLLAPAAPESVLASGVVNGLWLLRRNTAVSATADGLLFSVPPGVLPVATGPGWSYHLIPLECSRLAMAGSQPDGIAAVACDDRLIGLVTPDFLLDEPWPGPRGPGNSGCLSQPHTIRK